MEPLYQIDMVFTYEVYEQFNKFSFARRLRRLAIMMVLLVLPATVLVYLGGDLKLMIFFTVFVCAYPLLLIFYRKRALIKTWQSHQILQNQQIHIDFYEDRIVQTSPAGTANCPYEKLYKVLEDDRMFCLMISSAQGIAVAKANCSEELIGFLRGLKKKKK